MYKRLFCYATTLALWLWNGQAQAQKPLSLEDCVNYALSNNPQIRIAQLQIADADWRVKENLYSGFPQLSAGADYSYFLQKPVFLVPDFTGQTQERQKVAFVLANNFNFNVSYQQLLFNSSYLIGLRAARYYREFVEEQAAATRQTLRNQVTEAYLPALLISENLRILDKNIANLERLLNETRAIIKAGFAEQLDADRLELSLATLQSERVNLQRQREVTLDALRFAMGYPPSQTIEVEDRLEPLLTAYAAIDIEAPLDFQSRGDYRVALTGRKLNLSQEDIYRKAWMPTLAGFVQYQGGWQGEPLWGANSFYIPQAVAGIRLSIPVWDGGQTRAKKERAILATLQTDQQIKLLEGAITLETEAARKLYRNAAERRLNQQKNLDLAQRIYETTQTKYKAGAGASFELIQAEQQVYAAQQALLQAEYDLIQAVAAFRKATGL